MEHRLISQQIIQYFKATYQVNSSLFLLQVSGKTKKDANQSRYNVSNASIALNLRLDMIAKGVMKLGQLLIMTSYRTQHNQYNQAIKCLALETPRMANI